MSSPRRDQESRWNVVYLDDHRAPDVDDMLDRVEKEAHRQNESEQELEEPLPFEPEQELEEPLPFEPEQLHAARDLPGMSDGERRRLPGKDAGEENQEPGEDWDGA